MLALPESVRLPLARGVGAVGLTRMFRHVRVLWVPLLGLLIVMVRVVGVAVSGIAAPLARWLIFLVALASPASKTSGPAAASNSKPAGALRIMVPIPTFPAAPSAIAGPLKLVYDPPQVPAEIVLPPVAGARVAMVPPRLPC